MSILDRQATFNQAIVGVEPKSGLDLIFVMHSINYQKQEILSLRRGVRQKNLNQTKIKEINIFIPDFKDQKKIVSSLESLRNQIDSLQAIYNRKTQEITELKKSLLQKAFSGELTKSEAIA